MNFVGTVPASKSILNRALVLQSYFPELEVIGDSHCDDVLLMKQALTDLAVGRPAYCGHAGTVLRFLAFKASRIPGEHRLVAEPRLLERPQEELKKILSQLNIKIEYAKDQLWIRGEGWKPQGDTLSVPVNRSSQFLSGVVLNAWNLDFDLYVSPQGPFVSKSYWDLTCKEVMALGLKMNFWDYDFRIEKNQKLQNTKLVAESDMSSIFALAAIAALCGQARISHFPLTREQPDVFFLQVFETMGVQLDLREQALTVRQTTKLNPISASLRNAPDLFPILATLCAFADGVSELVNTPHLAFKESDRLSKTIELLSKAGVQIEKQEDGVKIHGRPDLPVCEFDFDPAQDHRLAMAAGLLMKKGFKINLKTPFVVNKSFPEFWSAIGLVP